MHPFRQYVFIISIISQTLFFYIYDDKLSFPDLYCCIHDGYSEYDHESGEVKMGHWSFLDIIERENVRVKEHFTLDDKIDDSELLDPTPWAIKNDNGQLCVVQIVYTDY